MWRYKDYSIKYAEDYSKTMSISFFKKYWYLDVEDGKKSWTLTWTVNGEERWNIRIEVKSEKVLTSSNNNEKLWQVLTVWEYKILKSLRVWFNQTDKKTWEKKGFDYQIPLVSTLCNYWGERWWFICPCWGNRCWKLYLQNNWYFASRKTLWLKYEDQNQSRKWRECNQIFPKDYKAQKIYNTIKYTYRNGKPTRKYNSYLKLTKSHLSLKERESEMIRLLLS